MPSDKSSIIEKAQKLAASGKIEKAIIEWQKLLGKTPNDGNIYNTIGDLYLRADHKKQAIQSYLKSADAFIGTGFDLKSAAVFKKILKIDPSRVEIYEKLADLHGAARFKEKAIEEYEKALNHYMIKGDYHSCLTVYRKLARLDPDRYDPLIKMTKPDQKRRLGKQAIEEFRKALEVDDPRGRASGPFGTLENTLEPKGEKTDRPLLSPEPLSLSEPMQIDLLRWDLSDTQERLKNAWRWMEAEGVKWKRAAMAVIKTAVGFIGRDLLTFLAERRRNPIEVKNEDLPPAKESFFIHLSRIPQDVSQQGLFFKEGAKESLPASITLKEATENLHLTALQEIECHSIEILHKEPISLLPPSSSGRNESFRIFAPGLEKALCKTEPEEDAYGLERGLDDATLFARVKDLRHAISGGELFLDYQPKINLKTGRITGAEALVRWQHPHHGRTFPSQFIAFAEQTKLIQPLTLWVVKSALNQCKSWYEAGLELSVAVNLSAQNLQDPHLPEKIVRLIDACKVAPDWLELEVTERTILADPTRAIESLTLLSQVGVRLSVDNFRSDLSSLGYLKKLPVSEIKMDKSLVKNIQEDNRHAIRVGSTIALAHYLGMAVVAGGVENQETWDHLMALGCDAAQGYYMSAPVSSTKLTCWLGQTAPLKGWTVLKSPIRIAAEGGYHIPGQTT